MKKGLNRWFQFFTISNRVGHKPRYPEQLVSKTFLKVVPCSGDLCQVIQQSSHNRPENLSPQCNPPGSRICQKHDFWSPPLYRFWSNRILCIYCSTMKDLDTWQVWEVFGSVLSDPLVLHKYSVIISECQKVTFLEVEAI